MGKESIAKKYGLIISIIVGALIWALPTPDGMNITQHKLLSLFGGLVVLWVTIGVNFAVSSFIGISGLYFWVGNATGAMKNGSLVHDASFAVNGFASASLWLLITGFVISIAMTKTGVAKRLAFHMMRILGKTPAGAIFALMFANLAISPVTPSNTARQAAMLPIVEGIAQAYKVERGKSNFGKALALVATYANNITGGAFLTATIPNPVSIAMITAAVGVSVFTTWSWWAMLALPTSILVLIATGIIVLKMFPPEVKSIPGGVSYIRQELDKMGPMSMAEKKAVLYFLIALVLWGTDSIHRFNSTMVAFLVSTLIFLPKIGVLEWKETEKSIPWELFVYFGGVITLSNALMKAKAFEWVIQHALAFMGLEGMSMMTMLIIMLGFTIFSHVIWSTTTAMMGVMVPIYIGLAQAMGFDIVQFVLPLSMVMAYAFFLPFNTMGNIIMFGANYYTVSDQVKSSIVIGFVSWGIWVATVLTWWRVVGFY
ncbi:putative malate transporter YflS [bioreactor metagenome]|uniref:Putative malate transporter YflS n=1 Tax=bioreactor metagenome TaxID=1076179 RepID=A0A644TQV6_9ZZZZ